MDEPTESDKVNAKMVSIMREVKEIKKCFSLLSYKDEAMTLSP